MVFPRKRSFRRRYSRRSNSIKKAIYTKKPRDLSRAVSALSSKINKISRKVTVKDARCYYGISGNQNVGALVSPSYNYLSLTRFSDFQTIFGTDGTDGQGQQAKIHSFAIDNYISLENSSLTETSTIQFTYFIVSLKPEASSLLGSTGLLNTLTSGTHYFTNGGLTMVNKRFFNIHYYKKFVLTNNSQPLNLSTAQSQYGTDIRFKAKVKVNRFVRNPAGDWKGLNFSPEVGDNYYALVFNDNNTSDLESPKWQYTEVIAMNVEA